MDKNSFANKVKTEIERKKENSRSNILWAGFSLTKEEKNILVQNFSNEYNVVFSECVSCRGYDVYIERKGGDNDTSK